MNEQELESYLNDFLDYKGLSNTEIVQISEAVKDREFPDKPYNN